MDRTEQRVAALEQEVSILTTTVKAMSACLQKLAVAHNTMVQQAEKSFATTNKNFQEVVAAIEEIASEVNRDGDDWWKRTHDEG